MGVQRKGNGLKQRRSVEMLLSVYCVGTWHRGGNVTCLGLRLDQIGLSWNMT